MLWQTLGGEPRRYAFAWSDKLGTGSIAHDGSDGNSGGKWEGEDKWNPGS